MTETERKLDSKDIFVESNNKNLKAHFDVSSKYRQFFYSLIHKTVKIKK